jgi:hypothetical protein
MVFDTAPGLLHQVMYFCILVEQYTKKGTSHMTKPYKVFNVRLDLATSDRFENALRAETKQGIAALLIKRFIAEREAENRAKADAGVSI